MIAVTVLSTHEKENYSEVDTLSAGMGMEEQRTTGSRFSTGPAIVLYIAAAVLLLQLITANRYGYFGDEMYHMACGEPRLGLR